MEAPLRSVSIEWPEEALGFPFSVPALAELGVLDLGTPVTFLVGENGSGKSSFLEALAWAVRATGVGSVPVDEDPTLEAVRPLGRAMRPIWNRRAHRGFFLRAEDFFGYVKRTNAEMASLDTTARALRSELRATRPDLPEGAIDKMASPYEGSAAALRGRYGDDLDARSHGEQFLSFFEARIVPGGLYLLDEPEVPLSPARQLALLSMIHDASTGTEPSQFVIATHSPILMALPGARIYSFDELPVQAVDYDSLEHVQLTRDFLNAPERMLRHLLDESED